MATGSATLDFGSVPGVNAETTVDVTGQSGLSATSALAAYLMAEATTDNSADAHAFGAAVLGLACELLTATSFRIRAISNIGPVSGTFTVRWVTVP